MAEEDKKEAQVQAEGPSEKDFQDSVATFQEKVARTVFLQELSPNVGAPVIASALGQFGAVVNVEIVKNPADPKQSMGRALVEMENAQTAQNVIATINEYLFMVGGIPRPVTARKATASLFSDSPLLRNKPRLAPRLIGKGDEGWEEAYQQRNIGYKHLKQIEFLAKHQKKRRRSWQQIRKSSLENTTILPQLFSK